MIRTAVILAAGMGTRLQNVLKDVPKGFLQISGKSLIEQSISKLHNCGIENIIIVTGHLSDFYNNLAKKTSGIITIHNDIYASSGSMYSFYLARQAIKEDFLLLESDLIYEKRALSVLQAEKNRDVILLSGKTGSGDEVYAEISGSRLINLSKDKSSLNNIAGELVGISKFSLKMFTELANTAEIMFKESLKVEYEQCVVNTAARFPIFTKKIKDLVWAEIDDENHLNRVVKKIAPRLKFIDNPG